MPTYSTTIQGDPVASPAPVSGVVTANIGTTNGLALDATLSKLTLTPGTALGSNTGSLIQGSVTTVAPTYTTGNINPLSLTTAGALRIDGSGVTQPVSFSGNVTVIQPTGTNLHTVVDSGSITIANASIAVTQSTSPWVVSGTVTSNIGTTNGLALDATVAKLNIIQGTALGSNTGPMIQASVTTSTPTYTTGQISPLSMDTTGALRVTGGGVAQGSTTSGQSGQLIQGAVTTAAPTYTTAQTSPLSLTTTGSLRTDSSSWLGSTAPTVGQKTMANSIPVVLASDSTQAIPTSMFVSAVTKNNQMYGVSVSAINAASTSTDNPMLLIRNPSGSGKVCYIHSVKAGTMTTARSFSFHVYSNPTVTANGTAQTSANFNVGGGAGASSILVTSVPTVTANGTDIDGNVQGQNGSGVVLLEDFQLQIQPNNSILITGNPSSNNTTADIFVVWAEV